MSAGEETASAPGAGVDPRHILIIGAGPGLGAAVARRFARERFRVTLAGRREEPLAALATELRASGATVDTVLADAGDQPAFRGRLQAWAQTDAPGVVVYNAALVTRDIILNADTEYLQAAFSVDVLGAVAAAQVFTPAMVGAGAGTFLTTGGGPGLHAEPAHATLSIGKAALRAVTSMLHDELAPKNVHASIVTVAGDIAAGTAFAPDRIAEVYWRLHRQPASEWRWETVFEG
ncbi:SDR family NAD(P)-dependent oxidoreductase [Leifsonia poae]|uniref:SDR family NAD(P)-dependent oxidoreductase n=1 Tax=Leifsonia poae TaxID=110933 RepID=UPI003D666036